MDVLIEIVFEFIAEIIAYAYVGLIEYFMPKKLSEKAEHRVRIIALFVALFLFVGLVAGIILVVEGCRFGWIFIIFATVYFVIGTALGLIRLVKGRK